MNSLLGSRIVAKGIDLFVVLMLGAFPIPYLAPLAGFFYSLVCDGIVWDGKHSQSVGKWLLRLEVKSLKTPGPIGFRDAIVRNSPFGLVTLFAIIPAWGWLILFIVGVPLLLMETYLISKMDQGQRLGDTMADTIVAKVGSDT